MLPVLLGAVGLALNARPTLGSQTFDPHTAVEALDRVPRAELPARAASLVAHTPAAQREPMAVALAVAVAVKRPAALVPVVAAMTSVATNDAPAIAAAAAGAAPDQAPDIAQVALQASPPLAARIIDSVQTVAPRAHAALMRLRVNLVSNRPPGFPSHEIGRKGHRGEPSEGEAPGPGRDEGRGQNNGGDDGHGQGQGQG
ncbi:MAG: hypothetical protein KGS61_03315, partial [Verrucomicrobia bacterium]|nr:hypothetical protein [Verrucomicrobiota bacterium]